MIRKLVMTVITVLLTVTLFSCVGGQKAARTKPADVSAGSVKLIVLDPGHFHAALIQKKMYGQVSPTVYVYAPKGTDVNDYLKMVGGFNSRAENPTRWEEKVYIGDDFLKKMLAEKPGNVVVLAGNNKKKAEYIEACVDAGLNVLADKPMCIEKSSFGRLQEAFAAAKDKGVALYDIMTERSADMAALQKELVNNEDVFGQLQKGMADEPAIEMESVHHFYKTVAGNALTRPWWFFDTRQQGEGLADVATHLVDMAMWVCFPETSVNYQRDIEVEKADHWPTMVNREQFVKVTGLPDFPNVLKKKFTDKKVLPYYANGEMIYKLKGVYTRVRVKWNFEAPAGGGDTQYSIIRGSKANVAVRQGKEQNYRPEIYVEPAAGADKDKLGAALGKAVEALQARYPGMGLERQGEAWHIKIPDKCCTNHEAHFGKVMERYLKYIGGEELPAWEAPNMEAKYYATTKAVEVANRPRPKVEFVQGEKKIDVMIGGKLFTSYLYGSNLAKPALFPVNSPSGVMVCRGYPLAPLPGDSNDHLHHTGIFFGYGDVDGNDFWRTSAGSVRHIRVADIAGGDGQGELATIAYWVDKKGQTLLEEKRDMNFYAAEDEYAIDFSVDLTAKGMKVVFGDTKEGMFAIRVADWMRENASGKYKGSGRYLSSEGSETEKNIWGRRARWVSMQADKDGEKIGVAIFNHPESVNYPTYWMTRAYGLFSADPLGQGDFQRKLKMENPQDFKLALNAGETAHFRFLIIIYEGTRTKEQLERRFERYLQ